MQRDARRLQRAQHGSRLEQLVRDRWRDPSGIRGLSEALGVSRATLYSWFRGQGSPDTASLSRLAQLLGTRASELVAALEEWEHPRVQERMVGRAAPSWRGAPDSPAGGPMLASEAVSPLPGPPPMPRAARRGINPQPPLDLSRLEPPDTCTADEPIGPVARRMYERDFSQLPVRDRDAWIGLLTTETIARWVAARSARGLSFDEQAPVREVLPYAEDPGNYRIVGPYASAAEILQLFEDAAGRGAPLQAVLVTRDGSPEAESAGILTTADLPGLRAR